MVMATNTDQRKDTSNRYFRDAGISCFWTAGQITVDSSPTGDSLSVSTMKV